MSVVAVCGGLIREELYERCAAEAALPVFDGHRGDLLEIISGLCDVEYEDLVFDETCTLTGEEMDLKVRCMMHVLMGHLHERVWVRSGHAGAEEIVRTVIMPYIRLSGPSDEEES